MKYTDRINSWFELLINEEYQSNSDWLALFRVIYSSYFLIFGIPLFFWIHNNPDILFDPPIYSLANFFEGFPPLEILVLFDLSIITLLVFLLFGFKTRFTSILLSLVLIISLSFKFSFGKIDHSILLVILPLVLSGSGWGNKLSIDSIYSENKESKISFNNSFPLFIMALLIGFGYFSSGYAKAPAWLSADINSHGVRSWVLNAKFISEKPALLLSFFAEIKNPIFWKTLDFSAVIFELTFFIAVFRKEWFKLYLGIAVIFHFANTLMIYIPFRSMMVIFLLFIDWNKGTLININDRLKKFISFKSMLIILTVYIGFYLIAFTNYQDSYLSNLSILDFLLGLFIDNPKFWIDHFIMSTALITTCYFGYKNFFDDSSYTANN